MNDAFTIIITIFSTFSGAAIAILTLLVNKRIKRKEEKRKYFIELINSNRKLFSIILIGASNRNNINYVELRRELESSVILPMLWGELQQEFLKLYDINGLNGIAYDNRKEEIFLILCNIKDILNEYGVIIFG